MRKSLVVLLFLAIPLYTCTSIDNPLGLLISNSGKSIVLKNEAISNVKSISLETAKITIKVKEEKLLLAPVSYKDNTMDYSNKEIEWLSQDKSIAIVDEKGKLTGIGEGEVGIIAKYKNEDKFIKVIVKVTDDTKVSSSTPTPTATPTKSVVATPTPLLFNIPIRVTPTPTIANTPNATSTPTATPIQTATPTPTPTPLPTDTPTPVPTATPTPTATPLPTDTPSPTPTPTPLPTNTPLPDVVNIGTINGN